MRGVILAGGCGTRLFPLTASTNKHLVPVGRLPMIEYPLSTLVQMGVKDISIVTGGEHFSSVAEYLMCTHPEINFSFHSQKKAGGIAQALSLVETSVGKEKIAVILGDNIFEGNFKEVAEGFEHSDLGALLFLKKVSDPHRFGVAEIRENKIIGIEEKPKNPKSNLCTTGLYFYDNSVFDKIRGLTPSSRGEYEITDANNLYVNQEKCGFHILEGFWSDAGTIKSNKIASEFAEKYLQRKIVLSLANNLEVKKKLEESFGKDFFGD